VIPAYGHATKKDPAMYLQWMQIYRAIDNPLVFFTEKHSVAKEMISIRQGKPTIVSPQNNGSVGRVSQTPLCVPI